MSQPLEIIATQVLPLSIIHTGNSFMLSVGEQVFRQSTCEFLLTFSSMVGTDIEAYLADLSSESDEVRVPLSSCGEAVVLSLADFARLRNVYGQMMFELKLQDLLLRNAITPQRAFAPVE